MINALNLKAGALFLMYMLMLRPLNAQEVLTLKECYVLAERHYPLTQQRALIGKTEAYTLRNIASGRLPQFHLGGQATYQSEVTQIPFSPPGIEIEALSKDQYKLYGEVVQTLYDGGLVNERKKLAKTNTQIDAAQLEADLYQLKERINQLFFGILLIDEKLRQSELIKADIDRGILRIRIAVDNGLALQSDLKNLQAEKLKIVQRVIGYEADRQAFLAMLGAFTGRNLSGETLLERPPYKTPEMEITRPELVVFGYNKQRIEIKKRLIDVANRPKVSLFVQGGYGRPALNMLDNDFSPYYIGGIRFSWSLSGHYTSKADRQLLDLSGERIDIRQETFLFNTNMALDQQRSEITRLRKLIEVDEEIIALRREIKEAAIVRLENGTITTNDYLKEINAEDQARQQRALHEIQLLMAQYTHKTIAGN